MLMRWLTNNSLLRGSDRVTPSHPPTRTHNPNAPMAYHTGGTDAHTGDVYQQTSGSNSVVPVAPLVYLASKAGLQN